MIDSVLCHFHPSLPSGTSRTAVDSHDMLFVHDNGVHASQPGIAIKASGPSFEVPEHPELTGDLGYTNVATVIDVRTDAIRRSMKDQAQYLAILCR